MGFLALLRSFPDYRRLFIARTISLVGDWFNLIALIALLREVTGGNAETLGAMFILKMLPTAVMGPLAGVTADRYSRKTIMVLSDLTRFLLVMSFFLIPYFPGFAVPLVLSLTFLQACGAAFFEPAYNALLPNLLPPSGLSTANVWGAASWSITYALGSGLGGFATHLLGWQAVLLLDALTFLISAWLVWKVAVPARKRKHVRVDLMHILGIRDMISGFHFIRGHPRIAYCMFLKMGLMLGGSFGLVLTLFGERIYTFGNRPDLGVAILMTARAAGTGVGPVLARRLTEDKLESMRKACLFGFFFGSLFYVLFGIVKGPYLAVGLVFIAHMGSAVVWVFSTVMLQRLVPDEFRGRVFASELGMATLMIAGTTWAVGVLVESVGMSLFLLPIILGSGVFLSGLVFTAVGMHPSLRGRFNEES